MPRELLRSRRLRPLGRRPAADRGRVGIGRARYRSRTATSWNAAISILKPPSTARELLSVSATSGSGLPARTLPTLARGRQRVPSASTTPSSCATNSSSAAGRARPQLRTSVRLTEISSPPRLAGSSRGSDWRKTYDFIKRHRFPATTRRSRGAGSFSRTLCEGSAGRKRKSRANTFTMKLARRFSTRFASSTSTI